MTRRHAVPAPRAPAEVSHLTSLIGEAATLRLIELHAGSRVPIPKSVNQGSKLAQEIGLEAARSLVSAYPDGRKLLPIPSCKHWRAKLYAARGETTAVIALKLGWDERTVYRALRDHKAPPRHEQMRMDF